MYFKFLNNLGRLFQNKASTKYYVSVCCIQKDENQYLLEWVKFHIKVGVDHFFIYDNGSEISPRIILREFIENNIVTIIDFPGSSRQNEAYMHCIDENRHKSKWIACIDVDEFIVPKKPYGDLKGFLKNYEQFGGVGINWLIFGSNGHKSKTYMSQLESFTMRSDGDFPVNKHIKSIIQPYYVKDIESPHHFSFYGCKKLVNENYDIIDGPFSPHSSIKIQINHYYCRSEEEYLEKIKRGYADHIGQRLLSQYEAHNIESNKVLDEIAYKLFNNK